MSAVFQNPALDHHATAPSCLGRHSRLPARHLRHHCGHLRPCQQLCHDAHPGGGPGGQVPLDLSACPDRADQGRPGPGRVAHEADHTQLPGPVQLRGDDPPGHVRRDQEQACVLGLVYLLRGVPDGYPEHYG